jgi:deoxyribonuclease V
MTFFKMTIPHTWLYPASLEDATAIQRLLADRVRLEDDGGSFQCIGGMDVSHHLYDPGKMVYAACVSLDTKTMTLQAQAHFALHQPFPYVPGFLGFREAPALVEAFQRLPLRPEIILVDGHGISHPRHFGIASHMGVLLDIPTIGVAKSILVGTPQGDLGPLAGDRTPLIWKGQQLGMVVRTKRRCHPLIISAGHRITLQTAVEVVLDNLGGYRLPEATRQAHLAANACRKDHVGKR